MHLATLTTADMVLLRAAIETIELDEVAGDALHLLLRPGRRTWLVQGPGTQVLLESDDESVTGAVPWVAVSERVRHFADARGEDLALRLVDGVTVVAEAGNASAAVDVVPLGECPTPWPFTATAGVTVTGPHFVGLLWSARFMPNGVEDDEYPTPPMWLRFTDDGLALHVDWSDFLDTRSTFRLAGDDRWGEATVAIPHKPIEAYVRSVPTLEDSMPIPFTIEVGTAQIDDEAIPAIRLSGPGWAFTARTIDPLRNRWGAKVRERLDTLPADVEEQTPTSWLLDGEDGVVHVQVHRGHPDLVRVSACLVTDVAETFDLLRELGALNAASSGVRFWWEDDAVFAAGDVRCTVLADLPDTVREVMDAMAQYAPMLAALGAPG